MSIENIYLYNIKSKAKINLKDKGVCYLGRNEECEISDLCIPKKQLSVMANYHLKELHIEAIGGIISGINNFALKSNVCYKVGHNDLIEVKKGEALYKVLIEPSPDTSTTRNSINVCNLHASGNKKRKFEGDLNENCKRLMQIKGNQTFTHSWQTLHELKLLVYTASNIQSRTCIAAFDLDGTLIKTKSGSRFPKDRDDWMFFCSKVINKLRELVADEYKIVIFTNQAGLRKDTKKIENFKKKIENIVTALDLPIQVFISTTDSIYRKPATGMWEALQNDYNNNQKIAKDKSFYVGDAAGRPENWMPGKKKDHSVSDRLFALNLGITFYTPDEYFLGNTTTKYIMPEFNPSALPSPQIDTDMYTTNKQEMIIMVGIQGSGKTTFCRNYLIPHGYIHINRDQLGSWQKCVSLVEKAIASGKSVVIDNTNPDPESRAKYLDIAKQQKLPVRCFLMATTNEHAKHNLKFRTITDESQTVITDMIFNSFKKKYKKPTLSEGFYSIVDVEFAPSFASPKNETLYKMFLV